MDMELKEALRRAVKEKLFLFPIRPGTKDKPLLKWREGSTGDPETWRRWLKDYPGCNFGVDCGKSGLFVLDVDMKNGHNGSRSLTELCVPHNMAGIDWHKVDTPSGGWQYWMRGKTANSAGKLGDGLDVRSEGGYVLLPGSATERGKYVCRTPETAIVLAPVWLTRMAGAPSDKSRAHETLAEWDDPAAMADAVVYLTSLASPVEGERDHTCYRVGCKLRDYAITEDAAVALAAKLWLPNWDSDGFGEAELARAFSSAYRYASQPAGNATAEGQATLACEGMPELPEVPGSGTCEDEADELVGEKPTTLKFVLGGAALDPVKPTPWLLGYRIVRGYVNAVIAPGGAGKSTLTVADALSVASGKPLLGDKVWCPGKVWMYNLEDDSMEIRRRIFAAAKHHGLSDRSDLDNVILSCGPDHQKFVLVKKVNRTNIVQTAVVEEAIRFIRSQGIVMFVGDPFIRSHACEENDNGDMDLVVQQWDRIAKETGCAVVLVHHTRKRGDTEAAGDMDGARGASAFVSAARSVSSFYRMTKEEGQAFGLDISNGEHLDYLRLDNAKSNLAPPAKKARWFRMVDVGLGNADGVYDEDRRATVEPADLEGDGGGKVEDLLLWEAFERSSVCGEAVFDDVVDSAMSEPCWPEGMEKREANKMLQSILDRTPVHLGVMLRGIGKGKERKVIAVEQV